ncbi:MAG TPA: oxygen-independent coproporphyrinogen III oxidase, partial [Chryseosolibacter sp.]|nr:oxygen-independent coproporphyrinogen III oxidase [Chryseosolibacter sp.]
LPFCESLCTYCACNKRITKNHDVEVRYIRSLLKEWAYYLNIFGEKPVIRELHLGGGTPTFFSPENLHWLISYLLEEGIIHGEHEFSFEGHPNNTTAEHLQMLYSLGFRRVSFGVQDLDPKVQRTINRIQPFENLAEVTHRSKALGYKSVSFDLIYGLPFQTRETIERTISQVLALKPDRVSFYSYAHVPWVSPGQRGYSEADLPSDIQKRALYETGRKLLKENGYEDIGMDHFSLPHDSLYLAQASGKLHRNFMGYTTTNTELLIGMGASAISDAKYAYAQNLKKVEEYSNALSEGKPAIFKGHVQTPEDLKLKKIILGIACHGKINAGNIEEPWDPSITEALELMQSEGILRKLTGGLEVTESGRPFIRNICSIFDKTLQRSYSGTSAVLFSKSI